MWMINSGIYKVIFLAIILLSGISTTAPGQARGLDTTSEMYGGIEVSHEGVTAVALRVSRNAGNIDTKLAHSEITRVALWRRIDGSFAPQASADAALAVSKALGRLQQQFRVPTGHIYLIGSSRLGADHPANLIPTIKESTGLTLSFVDEITEVQLRISGTVPKVTKDGVVTTDSRNTSALLHIGSVSSQAGYELMRYSSAGGPSIDYVGMNIPHGVVDYSNEITQAVGGDTNQYAFAREVKASSAISFRQALRNEIDHNPGLMYRKKVFLTGDIAWAMSTLMYPEDRQPYIPITYSAITQFADTLARSPRELVFRNLSFIRDRNVRQEVEQEIEEIKATFTPQQLIAGAEMLRAAAEEMRWQEKKVMFARFGYLGGILTYVRLQITQ
jgi:hypothetical protein